MEKVAIAMYRMHSRVIFDYCFILTIVGFFIFDGLFSDGRDYSTLFLGAVFLFVIGYVCVGVVK